MMEHEWYLEVSYVRIVERETELEVARKISRTTVEMECG